MERVIRGRVVVPGSAQGELLFASQPLSFWGGYDQLTGEIIDRRHPLSGAMAAGRILAVPASKGSSTTSAVLLESALAGTAPAAIITVGPDRFLALASVVAEEMFGKPVPMIAVSQADFDSLASARSAAVAPDGSVRVS
jgi:predicted aconitase with swiveling domain